MRIDWFLSLCMQVGITSLGHREHLVTAVHELRVSPDTHLCGRLRDNGRLIHTYPLACCVRRQTRGWQGGQV
jgi:hypothetical protein